MQDGRDYVGTRVIFIIKFLYAYNIVQIGSYEDDQIHELIPLDDLESRADAEPDLSQLFVDVFKKDRRSRPSAKELLRQPIIASMQNYDRYFD